jgi:hypothetical protein
VELGWFISTPRGSYEFDTDGISLITAPIGDIHLDFLAAYGTTLRDPDYNLLMDINADGVIDGLDFKALMDRWNTSPIELFGSHAPLLNAFGFSHDKGWEQGQCVRFNAIDPWVVPTESLFQRCADPATNEYSAWQGAAVLVAGTEEQLCPDGVIDNTF